MRSFACRLRPVVGLLGGAVVVAGATASVAQILWQGELQVGRAGHTATRLTDGRILVAGGEDTAGPVEEAEIVDTDAGTVSLGGSLLFPRSRHSAILLSDGRVLLAGGHDGEDSLDSTEIYDPASTRFEDGPPMVARRSGHSATRLFDGRILIVGGDGAGTAELFDPQLEIFVPTGSPTGVARSSHGAVRLLDGDVLIAGGIDATGETLASAEIFEVASGTFTATAGAMRAPRVAPLLRLLPDGKVQVIGGAGDGSLEMYDPQERTFLARARALNPSAPLERLLTTPARFTLIQPIDPADTELTGQITTEELYELIDRGDRTITEGGSGDRALVAGGRNSNHDVLSSAFVVLSPATVVTTDRTDYSPGDPVLISGTGFEPGEEVSIVLHEDPATHDPIELAATANDQGEFTNQEYAPETHDLGVTYNVTATGTSSGRVAQTTFADGHSVTSVSPSSGPSSGGTAVTINGSGFTNGRAPFTVTFGSAAPVTGARIDNNRISATTPAHSAGSVTVTVTANAGAGNAHDASLANGFTFNAVCGNGVVETGEQCDLAAANGTAGSCCSATCQFRPSSFTCRSAAGTCDVAETCSGSSATCPANGFAGSGTVCRTGSGDVCDPDETCTGSGPACPVDSVQTATYVCRTGSGDICDPDETCSGTAGDACPADTVQASDYVCRTGSGDVCDPDETCSGTAGDACPADSVQAATYVCRTGSGDVCDPDELCTGTAGAACPADGVKASDYVCRDAAPACDVVETCTGSAGEACPADGFASAGTACGDDADTECTNPDTCTGTSAECLENHEPSGTTCGDPASTCFVQDTCNGGGSCSDNGFTCSIAAFLPPVKDGSTINKKKNATVPLKFQVWKNGSLVSDATANALLWRMGIGMSGPYASCTISDAPEILDSDASTNQAGLTYGDGKFHYNWNTKNRGYGCYTAQVILPQTSGAPVLGPPAAIHLR